MTKAAEKIIVALDVPTKERALELVEQLRGEISFFKIGLQLYTAEGPEIVRAVLATGTKVWLDLKLYDIPNTVARAVESASTLGVQMLTIHLSGGSEMIRAATGARNSDMLLLGVTVLSFRAELSAVEEPRRIAPTDSSGCLDFARHDTLQVSSSRIFRTASRGWACAVIGLPMPM